jgi:hypothetical protein
MAGMNGGCAEGVEAAAQVGFVLGTQHIGAFLAAVLSQPQFSAAMMAAFFSSAHVMFALRGWEAARGGSAVAGTEKKYAGGGGPVADWLQARGTLL